MTKQWIRDHYGFDVSIIIVNYKARDMLRLCLETLRSTIARASVEVIIVDNDSGDGSVEMMRAEFPDVKCLAIPVNLGHSGGCNKGMEAASGRYLFLLNNDTQLKPGAIETLAAYLDKNPRIGAAAPKVLNADGTVQGTIKRFPTSAAAIAGRYSLLARLVPNNRLSRHYLIYLDEDFTEPFRVDSASAAALMVRREAIAVAGPLDERYFLYWNDVDWCRSFLTHGYEVHCVPDAVLVHDQHKGGTECNPTQSRRSAIDFHLGAYRYYRKWHIPSSFHPMNAIAIIGLASRAAMVIAVGEIERMTKLRLKREAVRPAPAANESGPP